MLEVAHAALETESGLHQEINRKPIRTALVVLLVFYLFAWLYTSAHFMADTNIYTQAILRHQHGGASGDFRLSTANPFWDFGHLLWRPLGWLCFVVTRPIAAIISQQNERAEVLFTLIAVNSLAALACVIFFFLLARRALNNYWAAVLAGVAFCTADAFLNYAHSGNAYVVGLACLLAGMYFSNLDEQPHWFYARSVLAGVMYALAVLFWFPYIFVLPAAIALPSIIYGHNHTRQRMAAITLGTTALVGLVAYLSTGILAGVKSITDFRDWALTSSHGQIQALGLRALARLGFSIPRSFINMDRDGMVLKRYLVHDPYAHVSVSDLLRLSWWKVVFFYASVSVILIELVRSRAGRRVLAVLIFAVLPVLVFALFIFEAGSIERYLPLYPFIFLAYGFVIVSKNSHLTSKVLLLCFLLCMASLNIIDMSRTRLAYQRSEAVKRIRDLVPSLQPNSIVMAINEQDSLAQFRQNFPLAQLNLQAQWQSYDMLELNTARLLTWREDFASRVLACWRRGGTVWLPTRVFRSRPEPDWGWVEGDDKRISWTDVRLFFSELEIGTTIGGQDGFVEIPDDPKNQSFLESFTHTRLQ